jgi:hypothetical protein
MHLGVRDRIFGSFKAPFAQMEYLDRPRRSLLDVLADQQAKLGNLPPNHPDRGKIALRIINLEVEFHHRRGSTSCRMSGKQRQ